MRAKVILMASALWALAALSCKSTSAASGGGAAFVFEGHWIAPRASSEQMALYLREDLAYVLISSKPNPAGGADCRFAEQGRWQLVSSRSVVTSPVDIVASRGCLRPTARTDEGLVNQSGMIYRGISLKRGRDNTRQLTWEEARTYVQGTQVSAPRRR